MSHLVDSDGFGSIRRCESGEALSQHLDICFQQHLVNLEASKRIRRHLYLSDLFLTHGDVVLLLSKCTSLRLFSTMCLSGQKMTRQASDQDYTARIPAVCQYDASTKLEHTASQKAPTRSTVFFFFVPQPNIPGCGEVAGRGVMSMWCAL